MEILIMPFIFAAVGACLTSYLPAKYLKLDRENLGLFILCFGILYFSTVPALMVIGSMEQQRSDSYNTPIVLEKMTFLRDKATGLQNDPY